MDIRQEMDELLKQLADIEEKMEETTLSHSDQQLLDQAWEDLYDQIAMLQVAIEAAEEPEAPATTAEEAEYAELLLNLKSNNLDYYETDYGVYYNAVYEA